MAAEVEARRHSVCLYNAPYHLIIFQQKRIENNQNNGAEEKKKKAASTMNAAFKAVVEGPLYS